MTFLLSHIPARMGKIQNISRRIPEREKKNYYFSFYHLLYILALIISSLLKILLDCYTSEKIQTEVYEVKTGCSLWNKNKSSAFEKGKDQDGDENIMYLCGHKEVLKCSYSANIHKEILLISLLHWYLIFFSFQIGCDMGMTNLLKCNISAEGLKESQDL